MRPKLPTDDFESGLTDKFFVGQQEKEHKEKVEAKRYRIPIIISLVALLVAIISLLLQVYHDII